MQATDNLGGGSSGNAKIGLSNRFARLAAWSGGVRIRWPRDTPVQHRAMFTCAVEGEKTPASANNRYRPIERRLPHIADLQRPKALASAGEGQESSGWFNAGPSGKRGAAGSSLATKSAVTSQKDFIAGNGGKALRRCDGTKGEAS